jgi:hypothetical protein
MLDPVVSCKHLRYAKIAELDDLPVGRKQDVVRFDLISAIIVRVNLHLDGRPHYDVGTPAQGTIGESIP